MTYPECCADPNIFGPWFSGESWERWRVLDKALFGLPLTDAELPIFTELTGRVTPPTSPATEAWFAIGRRGGKDAKAASLGVYLATIGAQLYGYLDKLARGERGVVQILAVDRDQGGDFTSADIGKMIAVPRAGAASATLKTTISAVTDATHVTLAAAAGTALVASPRVLSVGSDSRAAFVAAQAVHVVLGCGIKVPRGHHYLFSEGMDFSGAAFALDAEGAILDFACAASTLYGVKAGGEAGSFTTLPALAVDHIAGQRYLDLVSSAAGLVSAGDVAWLWNDDDFSWSSYEFQYKKGEAYRVRRVDTFGPNLLMNSSFEDGIVSMPIKGTGWSIGLLPVRLTPA